MAHPVSATYDRPSGDMDAEYKRIVGQAGLAAKGRAAPLEGTGKGKEGLTEDYDTPVMTKGKMEENYVKEEERLRAAEPKKEGFLSKISRALTGESQGRSAMTEEERIRYDREHLPMERQTREAQVVVGETRARVVDEKDIIAEGLREKVIEEKEIVAPIAEKRVIEQVQPKEHVRIIEEVTRLGLPRITEKERLRVIDTKEDRKPVQRRLIHEEQIMAPVERRKIIEEVTVSESRRVVEEEHPIPPSQSLKQVVERPVSEKSKEKQRLSTPSRVAEKERLDERKEFKSGTKVVDESMRTQPMRRRVLDDYEVNGVVEIKRRFEEVQIVEIRRIFEEREALAKPLLDEEEIQHHHSKKFF